MNTLGGAIEPKDGGLDLSPASIANDDDDDAIANDDDAKRSKMILRKAKERKDVTPTTAKASALIVPQIHVKARVDLAALQHQARIVEGLKLSHALESFRYDSMFSCFNPQQFEDRADKEWFYDELDRRNAEGHHEFFAAYPQMMALLHRGHVRMAGNQKVQPKRGQPALL